MRLGFERVKFPGDETVGLLGTSYLVDVARTGSGALSFGPAVYGAITGERGGFFTFGAEAAWHERLLGPFGFEVGLYAGGGGGSAAPQGGGLMLRPHVDLLWQPGALRPRHERRQATKFPNGQIDSTQVGLVLDVATDFIFFPAARLDAPAVSDGRTGVGFDRIQIVGGMYRTKSGAHLNDGTPEQTQHPHGRRPRRTGPGQHAYWGLEAAGAAQSGVAGDAEHPARWASKASRSATI